ncbi:hypothetical protein MYX84_00480 [Acidobacteria bacterium AH-259-O06]|nr:hypothetical protein [Acidobacteria bacterium AH-259-L09]MDA2927488.1 hypothetical protein [Acidobacteria bacterium AH-259-G07]MDA2928420.1 hypothetical protein [Acidobacteria bacterium AH-259-O06]MDA2938330.1 hypothetical protein [Acidobacteria bacterium AH-259-A15]
MSTPIITKIMFTITFPANNGRTHVDSLKLHSLAKKQLSDMEVIDTIDHLFKCQRCFEEYRFILTSYQASL